MRSRIVIWFAAAAMLLAACASGPSQETLDRDRAPETTTTTEAPVEGNAIVSITNGSFRPSNLKIDLDVEWIVEFRHEDSDEREYVIEARNGEFMSGPLNTGDVFEVDMREFEPGIYRYFAFLGNNRIPGSIDTRPDQ